MSKSRTLQVLRKYDSIRSGSILPCYHAIQRSRSSLRKGFDEHNPLEHCYSRGQMEWFEMFLHPARMPTNSWPALTCHSGKLTSHCDKLMPAILLVSFTPL
ncbi:hypothetical protein EON65_56690 [archaeon]|nr:MAG: hypothetical protein EON65_56690 [archaeon]